VCTCGCVPVRVCVRVCECVSLIGESDHITGQNHLMMAGFKFKCVCVCVCVCVLCVCCVCVVCVWCVCVCVVFVYVCVCVYQYVCTLLLM